MALQQFSPPALPVAPEEYDPIFMNQFIRGLNIYFRQIGSTTPIVVDSIQLTNLPTSSTGLPSGSVWNNSGVLNIVP
jgi:hypothetical protein